MALRIDQYGLVTSGTDGGDSCHRTYSVLLVNHLLWKTGSIPSGGIYENAIQVGPANAQRYLEPEPGLYIRHPDPGWTSSLRTASRDQLTPVICFLAVMCQSPAHGKYYQRVLGDLIGQCLKRGMFAQNDFGHNGDDLASAKWKMPDFLNPDLWAIMASGYLKTAWAPLALPIMIFGDVFAVLGAMLKVWAPKNRDNTLKFELPGPDDVDDMNINNTLMARQYAFPTPLSWLARKIYKTFRRKNYGNTEMGEKSPIMGALVWYNRTDNTDIPELYRPIVEKY